MGIVSIDLRTVESCEDISKIKGKHSVKYFKRVFDHLCSCDVCKPIDFVVALRERRHTKNKNFDLGTSKTVCRHVARIYKAFGNFDKDGSLQRECAWFIINSYSYDLKTELSWMLTQDQVIDSIMHLLNKPANLMSQDNSPHWPTYSYQNKFHSYQNYGVTQRSIKRMNDLKLAGPSLKKSVTSQEIQNDVIFEKAAILVSGDFKSATREDFYRLLDVAGVING